MCNGKGERKFKQSKKRKKVYFQRFNRFTGLLVYLQKEEITRTKEHRHPILNVHEEVLTFYTSLLYLGVH